MTLDEALATNARQAAALEAAQADVRRLTAMVERLTRQLDQLLAKLGEKPTPKPTADPEPPPSPPPEKKAKGPKNRHAHGRGTPPAELPRDIVRMPTPEVCPHCEGGPLRVSETVETEEYDFVRAHVRIRKTLRTVCLCLRCLRRVTPPQPPMPFDRAACTFEMMAWILYAKCGLHLPLDRQRREFERQGAPIPSATLTRWWARGADLAMPIVAQLRLDLLADDHLQFDATGITVLDLDQRGRPAPQGQMLVFCNQSIAVFHYTTSKKGKDIEEFLTLVERGPDGDVVIPWKGTATADALSAHDRLFKGGDILEGGCNAHGLRKFRDDADKAPLLADAAMAFIGRFYKLEAEARAAGLTGDALLAWRRAQTAPVSVDFKAWLDAHIEDLLPKNPVRQAMQYYLNHWDALMRFTTDAKVPLDNNLSERLLRALAVGRNNWMFAGGDQGARRVATILSLIETCKLLRLDACAYLAWVLQRVVPHELNRPFKASDLTPAAYKKALQQAGAQQRGG